MPQQRGGYRIPEYKPFFGKMMQGVSQTFMGRQDRERTERIQAEKNKAAQAAWMGDPSAMASLQELDPELAMEVEGQRIEREAHEQQKKLAETGAKTKKAERFRTDLESSMQQLAQFPDFPSAQAFGQQTTDRMVEQYPEMWQQHGMPLEFDEEAFRQIKTRAGPQPLQEQPPAAPVRKTTMIEEVVDGETRRRLIHDDDGSPVIGPGGEEAVFGPEPTTADKPKAATGVQDKAAGFLYRMKEANKEFTRIEKEFPDFSPASKAELTQGFFQAAATTQMKQYRQAAQNWIRAKLRDESGAVIGEQEMIDDFETFFPVLGDGPTEIAQKKRARKSAEDALEIKAGVAWGKFDGSKDPGGSETNPLIATETDPDKRPPAGSWVEFPDGVVRQI